MTPMAHAPNTRTDTDTSLDAGNALMQLGHFAQAAAAYEQVIERHPGSSRAHNNLAVALAEQRQFDRAIKAYQRALQLDPHFAHAHFNLGNALHAQSHHAQAVACFDCALKLVPVWPGAWLNRGLALAAQGCQALAQASYETALAQRPDYPEAHNNLGLALQLQGQLEAAMKHFDRALALAPGFAGAHSNRAQLRLLLGDFEGGWPEYEWRWHLANMNLPRLDIPRWDGKLQPGLTLLLRAEQGFGDTLQFVRFAAALQRAGLRVIVECQAQLATLLERASGVHAALPRGQALPPCDAYIPLASLPGLLGVLNTASIPAEMPYLHADTQRVELWRSRLASCRGLRVGIAWKGSPGYPQDCHRSIPVEHFAVLADLPGLTLVNLQFGERAPQAWGALEPLDLDAQAQSFEHTAALITHLDLVISCDSVVAHLSGGLGKPVWLALPQTPDWRWLLGRDDSAWYPSTRLFRQTELDHWQQVFERIQQALRQP